MNDRNLVRSFSIFDFIVTVIRKAIGRCNYTFARNYCATDVELQEKIDRKKNYKFYADEIFNVLLDMLLFQN